MGERKQTEEKEKGVRKEDSAKGRENKGKKKKFINTGTM